MIKLKGKITISRRSDDQIVITIEDVDSCHVATEVEMSIYNFGKTVTGLGMCDCTVYYNDSGNIGKERQSKYVVVPAMDRKYPTPSDSKIAEHMMSFPAIAKLFKEHWSPRYSDFCNQHNMDKDGYRVVFERWIEKSV